MVIAECTTYFWPFIFMTISWAIAMTGLFIVRRTLRR
jgi:hypothetical protein